MNAEQIRVLKPAPGSNAPNFQERMLQEIAAQLADLSDLVKEARDEAHREKRI